jgi:hypothetical protein
MSKRPRPLFVYMDPPDRERLARIAAEAGARVHRTVSVSEYVREALKFAAEHKAEVLRRLGA